MELIWKELEAERLIASCSEQVHISGELPSPDARVPTEVLVLRADVIVDGTFVEQGKVSIEGRIETALSLLDEKDESFYYESYASFRHVSDFIEASAGMSLDVRPCIISVSAEPCVSGVNLNADVQMSMRLVSNIPVKMMSAVSGVEDLELKKENATIGKCVEIGAETLKLREEIASENVERIVSCEGSIAVRDTTLEQGAAAVSGTMTVSALYCDRSGAMAQLVRQIPFREKIGLGYAAGNVVCRAKIDSLNMRALGEEFAVTAVEADVSFTVFDVTESVAELPLEAFSPSISFGSLCDETVFVDRLGFAGIQQSVKDSVVLPENAADIMEPVYVSARPIVTEASAGNGSLIVRGVLDTTAVYKNSAERICVFHDDVPFETDAEIDKSVNVVLTEACCIASINGFDMREIDVQFTITVSAELIRETERKVLVGIAEKETVERPTGLSVYFASEGEGVFDVAKRYSVSCRSVSELNPEISEPLHEGDKLIVFA